MPKEIPFEVGEKLTYASYFNDKEVDIQQSEVIKQVDHHGIRCYYMMHTQTFNKKFLLEESFKNISGEFEYPLEKIITTYIGVADLYPVYTEQEIKVEKHGILGGYSNKIIIDYNLEQKTARMILKIRGAFPSTDLMDVSISHGTHNAVSLLYGLRTEPLKIGYSKAFPQLSILQRSAKEITPIITVSKIEEVEVPAGTFECYKLDISVFDKYVQTWWFTTDVKRIPVKSEAPVKDRNVITLLKSYR